jgi:hypothetical protein
MHDSQTRTQRDNHQNAGTHPIRQTSTISQVTFRCCSLPPSVPGTGERWSWCAGMVPRLRKKTPGNWPPTLLTRYGGRCGMSWSVRPTSAEGTEPPRTTSPRWYFSACHVYKTHTSHHCRSSWICSLQETLWSENASFVAPLVLLLSSV